MKSRSLPVRFLRSVAVPARAIRDLLEEPVNRAPKRRRPSQRHQAPALPDQPATPARGSGVFLQTSDRRSRVVVPAKLDLLAAPFRLEVRQPEIAGGDLAKVVVAEPFAAEIFDRAPMDDVVGPEPELAPATAVEGVERGGSERQVNGTCDQAAAMLRDQQAHQSSWAKHVPHRIEETERAWGYQMRAHGFQVEAVPAPKILLGIRHAEVNVEAARLSHPPL